MKMQDYLTKVKILTDKLKLPMSTTNQIIQTLNGLDFEHNHVVVNLYNQIYLSWIELQSQLLSFESRIEQLDNFNKFTLNASTNVTKKIDHQKKLKRQQI